MYVCGCVVGWVDVVLISGAWVVGDVSLIVDGWWCGGCSWWGGWVDGSVPQWWVVVARHCHEAVGS